MTGIETLTKGLVAAHTAPLPEMVSVFASTGNTANSGADWGDKGASGGKAVGKCPRCSSDIKESAKAFFCSNRDCKFALWKDSRFWAAKGKTCTAKIASALLDKGRVSFSDLKSERTGKTYAATIVLADDGAKTDFRMEFEEKGVNGA
jgi:DNA topoisomerase-3